MTSIVEVIQHYQRSIDSNQDNEARLLHCINKLYKLPIKVEHLQETGVGKTVNSLRKFNGEIGVAAKTLVTKWKAMVAAEEEPMDTTSLSNGDNHNNDADGGGMISHEEDEDENHNRNSSRRLQEDNKRRSEDNKNKPKEKHKSRSSSSCTSQMDSSKHSTTKLDEKPSKNSYERQKFSSPNEKSSNQRSKSKEKEREKSKTDHRSNGDHHKNRDCEKAKEKHDKKQDEKIKLSKDQKEGSPNGTSLVNIKSKSHSSGSKTKDNAKHSSSSSSKNRDAKHKSSSKDKDKSINKGKNEHKSSPTSSTKDPDIADRKRRSSGNDSADFKSPQPKIAKLHKPSSSTVGTIVGASPPPTAVEEDVADGSFDSSMGANFDDVLGMLNVPVKKSKKSSKSPSTPSSSTSTNNTSKKDVPTQSKSSTSTGGAVINKANKNDHTSKSSHSPPSTSKASYMKPDLLAPTTKLEPLDPSIALELPTISTNYRPMPLNQTVMDCVFNNSSSSTKPVRTLSDAEAITHGISSKTIRTKIYSGVRTGQTFQVPSLFDMCIRILQKNIDALEYTGGVPFEVLKSVLERATPQQLYVFEEYNPYLMEDSDILWQQHVSRNYRTKKRQENESWREMFIRCQEEEERRLSVLKDSIKASQKIAAAPIRKTQLAFVDSMVKPPRNILKRQEQFGTKTKLVATPAARVASLSNVTPNAAKTGDQRLKVPSTVRDHAQVSSSSIRPKKAPLMQKTLQFIRGRHKR